MVTSGQNGMQAVDLIFQILNTGNQKSFFADNLIIEIMGNTDQSTNVKKDTRLPSFEPKNFSNKAPV